MNLDIQSQHNYDDWDFAVVKCEKCGLDSIVFIYKDHYTADEQIKYICDATDYVVDSENGGFNCENCSKDNMLKGEDYNAVV